MQPNIFKIDNREIKSFMFCSFKKELVTFVDVIIYSHFKVGGKRKGKNCQSRVFFKIMHFHAVFDDLTTYNCSTGQF